MAFRKFLLFHDFFYESPERLGKWNNNISLLKHAVFKLSVLSKLVCNYSVFIQEVYQGNQFALIVLLLRKDIKIRRFVLASHYFTAGVIISELQNFISVNSGGVQVAKSVGAFILHYIAELPPTSWPGFGHVDAFGIFAEPFSNGPEFIGFNINR